MMPVLMWFISLFSWRVKMKCSHTITSIRTSEFCLGTEKLTVRPKYFPILLYYVSNLPEFRTYSYIHLSCLDLLKFVNVKIGL